MVVHSKKWLTPWGDLIVCTFFTVADCNADENNHVAEVYLITSCFLHQDGILCTGECLFEFAYKLLTAQTSQQQLHVLGMHLAAYWGRAWPDRMSQFQCFHLDFAHSTIRFDWRSSIVLSHNQRCYTGWISILWQISGNIFHLCLSCLSVNVYPLSAG